MQGETAIYLKRLDQERPHEGQTVIQAFQWVEGQVEGLKKSQTLIAAVGQEMKGAKEHAQTQAAAISALNAGFGHLNRTVAEQGAQHAETKVELQAIRAAASCAEPPVRAPPGWGEASAQAPTSCAYGCTGCGSSSTPPPVPGLAPPGGYGNPAGGAHGAGGPPSGHGSQASNGGSGPPAGSPGAMPACFLKSRGGNDECHCVHVATLMTEMAEVKVFLGDLHGDGRDRRVRHPEHGRATLRRRSRPYGRSR